MKAIFYLVLIVVFSTCSNNEGKDNTSNPNEEHNLEAAQNSNPGEITDESVYQLNSTWTTQDGNKIKLDALTGKVVVVAMVYTSCEFACPRIVADINRIKKSIDDKDLDDQVHFVLVSIDPKVDTPEKLHSFAREYNMSPDDWTLLNGKEGDILELAALLGVKYKKTTEKDYAHSNIITVLNKQGEIAHQQVGLAMDPSETIEEIENLVKKG